ncbi:ankyrin repeat domain-containing protein [Armatimonas sp.]|uniref:ankyrin repeat domain-containing protein n=1 Tax=Armatimonas sp. TaxID=1872638 RepID=UPI00374D4DC5
MKHKAPTLLFTSLPLGILLLTTIINKFPQEETTPERVEFLKDQEVETIVYTQDDPFSVVHLIEKYNTKPDELENILVICIEKKRYQTYKFITNKYPEIPTNKIYILMDKLVLFGNTDQLAFLLESGIPIRSLEEKGFPLLHSACITGNLDIVKLLIKHHANVNLRSQTYSPINRKMMLNEIISYIEKHQKNNRERKIGFSGTTPLMECVIHEDPEAVKLLLANGADKSIKHVTGTTAREMTLDIIKSDRIKDKHTFLKILGLLSAD